MTYEMYCPVCDANLDYWKTTKKIGKPEDFVSVFEWQCNKCKITIEKTTLGNLEGTTKPRNFGILKEEEMGCPQCGNIICRPSRIINSIDGFFIIRGWRCLGCKIMIKRTVLI